ncbi:MAG: PQQ-dependent sugar dehydrogenase [Candidatus Nitrosocosmicus sp.]
MANLIICLLAFALTITIIIGIVSFPTVFSQPIINDRNLKVELYAQGLKNPTSMAFLGPKDILVTEKDDGTVRRVVNGSLLPQPLLQVPVAIKSERGMLGLDIAKHTNGPTYVFLYYTESGGKQTGDDATGGIKPKANAVYRYELVNDHLVNPKLLLSLPAFPGPFHDGGKVAIGPDNNVYAVIGDLKSHRTQVQNIIDGPAPDNTSVILRVTQDGKVATNPPLGDTFPLDLYYAYGIRNSFGISFDPLTGFLWDTENGPNYADEINIVQPGFDSGWSKIQGIWTPKGKIGGENAGPVNKDPTKDLVNFDGKGKYHEPQFTWFDTVAPTALKFFNSSKLGSQYQNDLFVGDRNNGNLYNFNLDQSRTGFIFSDSKLNDKIANNPTEANSLIIGTGFDDGIGDIKIGPDDGYLYILTLSGNIFRILPSSA